MGKYLETIAEIRPKNENHFVLMDVDYIRGGYIQVQSVSDMISLPSDHIKEGMLCYVKDATVSTHFYIYQNSVWKIWEGQTSGGSVSVLTYNTLSDLENDSSVRDIGRICYIKETDDLRWYDGSYWKTFSRIYIQDTQPSDKGAIWIDTSEDHLLDSNTVIQNLQSIIGVLQTRISRLEYMNKEIDPGGFNNNETTLNTGEQIEPTDQTVGSDVPDDTQIQLEQQTSEYVPNTKAVKIKNGTYSDMLLYKNDISSSQLLWATDKHELYLKDPIDQKYYLVGDPASSSGGESTSVDGILTSVINGKTKITGIEMVDTGNPNVDYLIDIVDGKITLQNKTISILNNTQTASGTSGYYTTVYYPLSKKSSLGNNYIFINSVYCGGDNGKENYLPVSHNFIEISNLSTEDLNLNGIYLHYTEGRVDSVTSKRYWVTLPLTGTLKAGSTFLIRGSQCSVENTNTTLIKVGEPDIEWTRKNSLNPDILEIEGDEAAGIAAHSIWGEDGKIKFQTNSSFYLSTDNTTSAPLQTSDALWLTGGYVLYGFIDLVGFGSGVPAIHTGVTTTGTNILHYKYFSLDPVKQALQTESDMNNSATSKQWTYINMNDIDPLQDIQMYVPKCSNQNKNIFYNKPLLTEGAPNIVTCTFGYNASTTRCFDWISVGYYDEYIKVWKDGDDESTATITESFKEGDGRSSLHNRNNHIYDRMRAVTTDGTSFTAHKVILDFPEPVTSQKYNYTVGREGNWMDTHSFTLRNRQQLINNGFQFLQVTDQQGFHTEEYETWRVVSDFIQDQEKKDASQAYDWVLNTGDQTQNGNRFSEWIDYYRKADGLYKDKEQMFSIGNNDLCSENPSDIGDGEDINKINPETMNYFFTFEHPNGVPVSSAGKYIPSLYTFIYGDTLFLCMNSEITYDTQTKLYGAESLYPIIKTWCDNEMTVAASDTNIKWKVAYCHENPFTLLVKSQIFGTQSNGVVTYNYIKADGTGDPLYDRQGSHVNTVGGYWFSKFLEDNGFKICIGGHKHTYTNTKMLHDNTANRMKPYIYDSGYVPANGETPAVYPSWYIANSHPYKDQLCQLTNDKTMKFVRYITLQASGYKLTSNKELPTGHIPWEQEYYGCTLSYQGDEAYTSDKVNVNQRYPHYALWNIGNGTETEDPSESVTSRPRIKGKVYKVAKSSNINLNNWSYRYFNRFTYLDLTKLGGNGDVNPDNNIIVE